MSIHRILLAHALVLIGIAVALLTFIDSTAFATAQTGGQAPCPGKGDGDLKTWGVSFDYMSLDNPHSGSDVGQVPFQTVLVRPGEEVSITIRADICTLAPVPRMSGMVAIAPDAPDLTYVLGSGHLDATNVASYQLTHDSDAVGQPLYFSANTLAPTSELRLDWTVAVSDCAAIGSNHRIETRWTFDAPIGNQRADGTFELQEFTEERDFLLSVAPHPSTQIASYRATFHTSDTTPAPGWTEEYQLRITNEGTTRQLRGVLLKGTPSDLGPLLFATPRTITRHEINHKTSEQTPSRLTTETEDWYIDPPPGDTVVFSWTDTIARGTIVGTEFQLLAGAGHDTNSDGRALGADEVAQAQAMITVGERKDSVYVTQHAMNISGYSGLYSGDTLSITIRVRNPTPDVAKDLVLGTQHSHGLTYLLGSASYQIIQHPIDDSTPAIRPTHLNDDWMAGWQIGELEPYSELRIDFRAHLNEDLLTVGDTIDVKTAVRLRGALVVDNNMQLTVGPRAQLEFRVDAVESALAGEEITYVLRFVNDGNGALEDVTLAADLACGMSYVQAADWIALRYAEPLKGGLGYSVLSPDLGGYLGSPSRTEPFRFPQSIKPGEVVQITFSMILDSNLQSGTILKPTFYATGHSNGGYQLASASPALAIVANAATAAEVEAASEHVIVRAAENLEVASQVITEQMEDIVEESEASIIDKITDGDFIALEVAATAIGGLVGALLGTLFGYSKSEFIDRQKRRVNRVMRRVRTRWSVWK